MNSKIKVRSVRIYEAAKLNQIFKKALSADFDYFSEDYQDEVRRTNSVAKLSMAIISPKRLILGLYDKTQLIGFSIIGLDANSSSFLYWMYVLDKYRGKSLGKKLLSSNEKTLRAKKVRNINLLTHNKQLFYKHHGYITQDKLPNHSTGVTMYLMSKELV